MRQIELEHKHSKLSSLSYSLSSTKPCPVASNQAQDINVNVTQRSCYCSKHPSVGFESIPKHLGTSTLLCPNYKYPSWTWICFICEQNSLFRVWVAQWLTQRSHISIGFLSDLLDIATSDTQHTQNTAQET